MVAKIKIPRSLRNKTNGEVLIEVNGNTVYECVRAVIEQYPQLEGELLDNKGIILLKWIAYINNESVKSSDELSHPVHNGDVIEFLPLVDGG